MRSVPLLPAHYVEPRWYVAQTCPRHEKRAAEQLGGRCVEHFLPLYEAVSRWKDRRVRLQLPLFAGYVFVRLPLRDRLQVLQIPSVLRLVGFNGHPTALCDAEIEALRDGLTRQLSAKPHPFLTVGRRVRMTRGPFQGLEGILLRRKGAYRVVVSLAVIKRSIVVEIDCANLEPIPERLIADHMLQQFDRI